jgi:hypothetical protein
MKLPSPLPKGQVHGSLDRLDIPVRFHRVGASVHGATASPRQAPRCAVSIRGIQWVHVMVVGVAANVVVIGWIVVWALTKTI